MEPVSAEFLLPIEVWDRVFQHSRAKDALHFRLVCLAWKEDLDKHFDKWTVRLDQNSPYFQNLLQLKVKEATILDLKSPVDFGQEGTPRLFKHPDLLEKLSIPTGSGICLTNNMMPLLKSCRKTIKHLELSVGLVDHDEIFDPAHHLYANGLDFTNLKSLTLQFTSYRTQRIQEQTLFKVMVGLSTMRKIKSLRVFLSKGLHNNALFSTFLAFIGKNGRNLEEIEYHLKPAWPRPSADEEDEEPAQAQLAANSIDLALLRQVLRLQTIKIHYGVMGFNENAREPCETLLEAQRNLTCLHLWPTHISLQSLTRVFNNNRSTLTKIELCGLDFDIDLAILSGCMQLKELLLQGKFFLLDNPVLLNSGSLPVGIQKFESCNFFIESKDILKLFTGHGGLENIILQDSGFFGSNGVTAAVFAVLVINRNLSNKLTDVCISRFNCSTEEDLAALNHIFRGLNNTWEDRQDFRHLKIWMDKPMGEGGDWSVWKIKDS